MGVESKPGSLWFYCTLLCNWSRKSRHSLDQSDARIKSIAFSRAKQFEFSLANDNVYLCSDWLLGSSFFYTLLKTALKYYHDNKLTNRIFKCA